MNISNGFRKKYLLFKMEIKDLLVTPLYLFFFTVIAYWIRPYVTNKQTRKYFLPALWVRFSGAIMLGVIYQFYYSGGDTFSYWTHGSKWIWEAFLDDPMLGTRMLLSSGGEHSPEFFNYSSKIWYFKDPKSYTVVRIAGFFDLFTFHTYSATACFFAVFSFSGMWAMYTAIDGLYKSKYLALVILFVPSVVFWGSGILKDTITLGALGWLTWGIFYLFEHRRRKLIVWIVTCLSAMLIFKIKPYIVVCFIPLIFVWLYLKKVKRVRKTGPGFATIPILAIIFLGAALTASIFVSTEEYSINSFARKAAITAYDIRYGWGSRTGGDGGYDIGMPDGTLKGTLKLLPAAINASLFRPYLWEVRNPLMLLSALESLLIFTLTLKVVLGKKIRRIRQDPFLVFCLVFALLFAFAVGVSTSNFGTLMRYKIPLMGFYLVPIIVALKPSGKVP